MGFNAVVLVYRISIHEWSAPLPPVLNPDNPLHVQEYPPGFHWRHQSPCLHRLANRKNLPTKESSSEWIQRRWHGPAPTGTTALRVCSCETTAVKLAQQTTPQGGDFFLFLKAVRKPFVVQQGSLQLWQITQERVWASFLFAKYQVSTTVLALSEEGVYGQISWLYPTDGEQASSRSEAKY